MLFTSFSGSLVSGIPGAVQSVVGLAGKLGIDTVAEGVETKAQVNCLCSLGVDYLQGFYFGRPKKVDTFCCEYR
uniref:EAL domain-containing protein n=1 Tax=Escherichia coli TaxID=562 RepID=A0A6N0IP84_ECOLX|nr:EAL domain-containing protein [Escherichia coli]